MPDDVSLGELARRIERFEKRHDDERRSADARHLDAAVYVAERNHFQAQLTEIAADQAAAVNRLETEIASIKSSQTWLWRAALTGIVFPIILLIVGWVLTRGAP